MKINLTVKQLRKAASQHQYIAVRWGDCLVGINCKIQNIQKAKWADDKTVTSITGYYPISIMEYISIKTPYLLTPNN